MKTQPRSQSVSGFPHGRLFATVPEFVRVSGYDQRTVRKGIADGEIPAIRVGATWRIPVAWICEQAQLGATSGGADAA